MEATKQMKPPEGMYQTATKVKVLSPENANIEEADSFHLLEGRMNDTVMARYSLLFRGLRPWYGAERKLLEPGRPALFPQRWIPENNLKKRGFRKGSAGVGLIHSRGVARVMPCEETNHSKGLALICKGKGKHGTTTELEYTC